MLAVVKGAGGTGEVLTDRKRYRLQLGVNRSSLLVGLLLLSGCATSRAPAVVDAAHPAVARANLALGPTPEHQWLATEGWVRSDWPAVDHGWRVDEVIYFSTATYDWQNGFDQFGGLFRAAQSLRAGLELR